MSKTLAWLWWELGQIRCRVACALDGHPLAWRDRIYFDNEAWVTCHCLGRWRRVTSSAVNGPPA